MSESHLLTHIYPMESVNCAVNSGRMADSLVMAATPKAESLRQAALWCDQVDWMLDFACLAQRPREGAKR